MFPAKEHKKKNASMQQYKEVPARHNLHIATLLPARWQSVASPLASSCHPVGKTLPSRCQKPIRLRLTLGKAVECVMYTYLCREFAKALLYKS